MNRIVLLCALALAAPGCTDGHRPTSYQRLPACPTEDSVSCYWDAKVRGNGLGNSFWTEADGTVHLTG